MLLRYLRRVGYFQEEGRPTDGQLLERFVAQREEAAFEELLRRHGPMVLSVCRRTLHNEHDVEDAFQATFLVLVRKARSVKPRDLVGHWLYGVAYRTAVRARTLDARRRDKEKAMPRPVAPPTGLWRDVMPLLDRELSGLPEKYRIPVVLCDLEGKSRKEVAGILGCSEGTLSSRLARARALLAQRLSRRGVTLSGGALAALVAADGVSACVPAPLLSSTTKAALLVAAGQAATATWVSLQAAALAEGVIRTMLSTKLKTMALLCAVATVAIGAGGFAYQAQAEKGNPNLTAPGQDPGRPLPAQDERRGGDNRQGTENAKAQPNDEPQQTDPDLPRDAAKRIREFEAETEAIRKRADGEIQALRAKLLADLQGLQETYTKAGKLDEALAIRHRIRQLKAATENDHKLTSVAKVKKGFASAFLSHDGRTLALWSRDGALRFFNFVDFTHDGRTLSRPVDALQLHLPEARLDNFAFLPEGKSLAVVVGKSGETYLWDFLSERRAPPITVRRPDQQEKDQSAAGQGAYLCFAVSPDGKTLAGGLARSGQSAQQIQLWEAIAGKQLHQLRSLRKFASQKPGVCWLAFARDGRTLASASEDGTLCLWEVQTGKELRRLKGSPVSRDGALPIALAPDGQIIAQALPDQTIEIWDVGTGKKLHQLRGHRGVIMALAFFPDSKGLVSASRGDKAVLFWNTVDGRQTERNSPDADGALDTVALSGDGTIIMWTENTHIARGERHRGLGYGWDAR
jgi:RNA polymerase sigma-70 factor (ECF subfamily)